MGRRLGNRASASKRVGALAVIQKTMVCPCSASSRAIGRDRGNKPRSLVGRVVKRNVVMINQSPIRVEARINVPPFLIGRVGTSSSSGNEEAIVERCAGRFHSSPQTGDAERIPRRKPQTDEPLPIPAEHTQEAGTSERGWPARSPSPEQPDTSDCAPTDRDPL